MSANLVSKTNEIFFEVEGEIKSAQEGLTEDIWEQFFFVRITEQENALSFIIVVGKVLIRNLKNVGS